MVLKKQIKLLKEQQSDVFSDDDSIKKLYAKDAMIKPVLLFPDDDIDLLLKKLKKEHINVCIVVTKDKKFLGEISANDIIKLFLQQIKYEPLVKNFNFGYRREFLYKTAKDMINKNKSVVKKDTSINVVIELIQKDDFENIPVLDKQDKVIGVITPSSVINLLKDY